MKKIAVLLSVYNGEKYLDDQLNSLVSQVDVDITLFIRDDGSIDNSKNIIDRYKTKLKIKYVPGENFGFERSFMEVALLANSNDFDFFAFCDQDDIWHNDKLIVAVNTIMNETKYNNLPTLYCSNQRIIDENNIWLRDESKKISSITKQSSLLSLNQRGCVMVWNKELQYHLVNSYRTIYESRFMPAHDTWITILAYAVGAVIIDSKITMDYRVSSHNTAGSYIGKMGRVLYIFKKITKVFFNRKDEKIEISKKLLNYLVTYNIENRKYIEIFLAYQKNYLTRIEFILFKKEYFEGMSIKWRILSSFLILIGRI